MRVEYEVLRDALLDIYETAAGQSIGFIGDIDDDDLAEMTVAAVTAQRDALNEVSDIAYDLDTDTT